MTVPLSSTETYDNTVLSNFKRCPRYYYYRDILNLVPEALSTPLVFGSAWGKALDAVWTSVGASPRLSLSDVYDNGVAAFNAEWSKAGLPLDLDKMLERELSPRTPQTAAAMLAAYLDERRNLLESAETELIGIEQSFIIPLDTKEGIYYCGLLDKLLRHHGKILCIDHKSTAQYKKEGYFKSIFMDSFSPNSQVDGYLYALHYLFPEEDPAVWIDAALVHKAETGFTIVPIEKQLAHLQAWRWEALYWIRAVQQEKLKLRFVEPSSPFMDAFPRNTNNCFAYMTACPYMDICRAWTNPVGQEVPPGFRVEQWKPLERTDKPPLMTPRRSPANA